MLIDKHEENQDLSDNNFKYYLLSHNWSENLNGFVNDARMDALLPDPKSWEELEDYLGHHAAEDTIKAAKYIWDLYVADTHGQAG